MKQKLAPTQQWHDVHSPKVGRHPPPNHSTLQWHLQWHPPKVGRHPSLPWHTKMAPCNGTTSTAPSNRTTLTPSKLVVTRLAHYNGTLQWHHSLPPPQHTTMAPCNGTQQWHHVRSPKVGRHPAMAPSNGTTSAPPKLVVTLPLNHSTLQWHPTMAPSNGTTSTAPCNGTLVPRPIRQSGSSPSPLLEVRTPIAIAIWGKTNVFQVDLPQARLTPSPQFFQKATGCERRCHAAGNVRRQVEQTGRDLPVGCR